MSKKKIYEGKAKILYEGTEPNTIIQYFKDDATAFNNQKKGSINGKGVINNRISEFLMTQLKAIGVENHFIRTLNMREQLVKSVEIIPIEVIVRNVAAGSLAKRLGLEEGKPLDFPIVEFSYKKDELGDPLITTEHALMLGLADFEEITFIKNTARRINDFLMGLFVGIGIQLVDFKIEFGRYYADDVCEVILADEISPDSCRLWDMKTGEKMDKDRFRRDLGGVEEAYQEVAKRLGVLKNIEDVTEK